MPELLDSPIYGISEVDRLLALPSGTARRWIDGYMRAGREYPPVVRDVRTGSELVTWGEFVETKLLAAYRDKGVPMLHMRPAVQRLRERFNVTYPLALVRPWIGDRELVYDVQAEVGLDRALLLVVPNSPKNLAVARTDQFVLTSPSQSFVDTIDWDEVNDFITAVRPLGKTSPVVIDPLRQSGAPVVRSVPTSVIAEQFRGGDPTEMIAELYELPSNHVEAALRYELQLAS